MKKTLLWATMLTAAITAGAQTSGNSIVWPDEGYNSTRGTRLVPLDTDIHFDVKGRGTDWWWELPGAQPDVVEGRTATVRYTSAGVHDVTLHYTSGNMQRSIEAPGSIQAGGADFVWNISSDEKPQLDIIPLAFYGWYGGTNTLGMVKFAEHFHAPQQKAVVDSVAVWFGSYQVATADAELQVSIAAENETGMPGDCLATATINASQIVRSKDNPTIFRFEEPVAVDGPFFVVIGGFPNAAADAIAMTCLRREANGLCTAYHLLADEDSHYRPTGTYTWYKNVDDPTSFAISPWLNYDINTDTHIGTAPADRIAFDGTSLQLPSAVGLLQVFSVDGTLKLTLSHPSATVSLAHLPVGIYLVRTDSMVMKIYKNA